MDFGSKIQIITVAIIPLIFAITVHEAAHGWVANRFGDKTAWLLGRVTLNPSKHIDPIGTLLVPFLMLMIGGFIFGWAKPVPVNWQNLNNPRRDMAIVALAGPGANLLMALFWALIAKLCLMLFSVNSVHPVVRDIAQFMHGTGQFGIMINSVLMVLNLVPIPPLDGSRLVSSLLPVQMAQAYERIEPFGIWILLALIFTGVLQFFILPPIRMLIFGIRSAFGIN